MTKEELEKKAEDFAIIECCSTCSIKNPYSCEEKCECWTFATEGVKFGYSKGNEWHYVKNGDLPKHEVNVLVLYDIQCIGIAHYNYDYKEWHFADSIVHDVIAWKEIELPELKEDEIESEMFPEIILPEGSSEFIDKVIADAEKRVKGSE